MLEKLKPDLSGANNSLEEKFLERIAEVVTDKEKDVERSRILNEERLREIKQKKEQFAINLHELREGLNELFTSDPHVQSLKLYLKMTGEQEFRLSNFFNKRYEDDMVNLDGDSLWINRGHIMYRSYLALRKDGIYCVEERGYKEISISNIRPKSPDLNDYEAIDSDNWKTVNSNKLDISPTLFTRLFGWGENKVLRQALTQGITFSAIKEKVEELYVDIAKGSYVTPQ
jgi:hypothetical protein